MQKPMHRVQLWVLTTQHVKIAERVRILSYFHTTYKSMEKRAQGLNFIVCTRTIHVRDYLHFAEPCFDVR
jgi:hypothetical protein